MVFTSQNLLDVLQFLGSIREELAINNCSKFERIFHIAIFFVAKNFAMIRVIPDTTKGIYHFFHKA